MLRARVHATALQDDDQVVKKRVMAEAPKTDEIEIPAIYKEMHVRKTVVAAGEQRVEIPATYKNVSEQHLVSEGQLEWQAILCETNTTTDTVRKLQRALVSKGYDPGKIDGSAARQTASAQQPRPRNGRRRIGATTPTLSEA